MAGRVCRLAGRRVESGGSVLFAVVWQTGRPSHCCAFDGGDTAVSTRSSRRSIA